MERMRERVGKDMKMIGVGGIESEEKEMEKIKEGEDMVKIYRGMIYRGKGIKGEIMRGI